MYGLRSIFIAISIGIIIGVIFGGLKSIFRRKAPSQKQIEFVRKLVNKFAAVLKYYQPACDRIILVHLLSSFRNNSSCANRICSKYVRTNSFRFNRNIYYICLC